ncbi:hypothetical protein BH09SUM1_BH09SUM1_07040 [soil metagenome]
MAKLNFSEFARVTQNCPLRDIELKFPRFILLLFAAISLSSCSSFTRLHDDRKGLALTDAEKTSAVDDDYAKISLSSLSSGENNTGRAEVLRTAYDTLLEGKAAGKWPLVGLPDLWAHALKEAGGMMNTERRWGITTAAETKDLIGQTTVGPWQITVANVKNLGQSYGIDPSWADAEVYEFIRSRPEIQASMACDIIQKNYQSYGVRGPYAIQSYFWLQPFLSGDIGQAAWDKSVLATPPDGDWQKITAEQKRDTGYYGKQLFLGNRDNPYGLIYWLTVTQDEDAIRAAFRTWRDQRRLIWDEKNHRVETTQEPGGFAIRPDDLKYLKQFPEQFATVNRIVGEVLAEGDRASKIR